MSAKQTLIIAPHPDDELIGCYEVIASGISPIILYSADTDIKRREEALKLRKHAKLTAQIFLTVIPESFKNDYTTIYVPDPYFEIHPHHRKWGFEGETLARMGIDVIFYSVNMNTPYIHDLSEKDIEKKKLLLNTVYDSQRRLWEYDEKYILFEGRCKWLFNERK